GRTTQTASGFSAAIASSRRDIIIPLSDDPEAAAIKLGVFINAVINFIIVAFAIFLVVKGMNKMQKQEEEAPAKPPEPSAEEKLLTEIRDLLSKQG
ncbi:MAG: MscL family protein, partial [Pseudomonadota bacterium]